jgi:UDP-N-acetylmuramoylalanine-D-glutamate ligase
LYKEIENKIYRINYCGAIGQRLLNELYKVLGTSQTVPIENFKDRTQAAFFSLDEIKKHFENWLQQLINNYQEIGEFGRVQEILSRSEIVLNIALSPCGSSFDEFKNATQRSEWWVEQVQKL